MEQVLTLGSVLPAALGAGCCAASRRTGWFKSAAMVLMVVSMGDTMLFGEKLLSTLTWSVVLIATALALRLAPIGPPRAAGAALHVGAMGLLTAAMAVAHGASGLGHGDGHAAQHMHMHVHDAASAAVGAGAGVTLFTWACVLVGLATAVLLGAQAQRCTWSESPDSRIDRAEKTLTATSLLAMSAVVLLM